MRLLKKNWKIAKKFQWVLLVVFLIGTYETKSVFYLTSRSLQHENTRSITKSLGIKNY